MKTFKRNAVIITVLVFVCVAAYLNWSYNRNAVSTDTIADTSSQTSANAASKSSPAASDAGLFYKQGENTRIANYFSNARLNRKQAKDEATATLTAVSTTSGATQDTINAALAKISNIASNTQKEAELENLVIAKGYSDCVVDISDDGISVTVPVPGEGLSQAAVAQITDAVTSGTNFKAGDLKIIEVK